MALGEFETDDLRHFLAAVRPNDVVFDIGANVGAYCIPVAKMFPDTKVFAFEPNELNAALIRVSQLVNKLPGLSIVSKCVSDRSGVVEFSLAEDSAYSSMIDTRRKREVARAQIPATSLDDFCATASCPPPNIMKIDVEGAELKVLHGAQQLFAGTARPRLVLMELYDENLSAFGASIDDVALRMSAWGYAAHVLIDGVPVLFSPKHHNVHYNVFFSA
jgi:FkbM family methyltransferase